MRSEDSFLKIGISIILISSDFDGIEMRVSANLRNSFVTNIRCITDIKYISLRL